MAGKYAELVAAEAGQDDDPADDPADDGTQEPAPEPAGDGDDGDDGDAEPSDEASAQALVKKLDSENTRHAKTLARLMEVDVSALEECPQCASYGFLPPGQTAAITFLQDPQAARCEVCDGRGMTLTGAQEPAEATYNCSACGGRGWKTVTPMPAAQPVYETQPNGQAAPVAPPGYVLVPTGV